MNRRHLLVTSAMVASASMIGIPDAKAANPIDTALWGNLFYGEAAAAYGSGNAKLNAAEAFSYAYRAEMAGYITSVRVVFERGTGYAAGDGGGPYDIQIRSDSGGFPSSTVIATSTNSFTAPGSLTSKANWAVQFNFPSTTSVTKNQQIHFVVRNKRSSGQSSNYLSVNHYNSARLWTGENPADPVTDAWKRSPYFHTDGSTSLTMLHRLRGVWKGTSGTDPWRNDWTKFPTIEIDFKTSPGSSTVYTKGQSVVYHSGASGWTGLSSYDNYIPISSTNYATYTFEPTGIDRVVGTEFYTKLLRISSWNGAAYVDLSGPINANGSTDTVRFTFTSTDGPAPLVEDEGYGELPHIGWIRAASANKSGPFYLRVGSQYTLKWTTAAGGTLYLRPMDSSSLPIPSDLAGASGVTTLNLKGSFRSESVGGTYKVGSTTGSIQERVLFPFLFRVNS